MAQEQFNPLDLAEEAAVSAGDAVANALAAMHAQVNEMRGSQEPKISAGDDAKQVGRELPPMQIDSGEALNEVLKPPKEGGDKEKEVLSRSERRLMSDLTAGVGRDNVEHIRDALEDIAKNPDSSDRVMRAAAEEIRKNMPGISVSWEKGTNSNGEAFVRLKLDECSSKSGPFTHLTIGSDGVVHGNHTPYMQYGRPSQLMTGDQAFQRLRNPGVPDMIDRDPKPRGMPYYRPGEK